MSQDVTKDDKKPMSCTETWRYGAGTRGTSPDTTKGASKTESKAEEPTGFPKEDPKKASSKYSDPNAGPSSVSKSASDVEVDRLWQLCVGAFDGGGFGKAMTLCKAVLERAPTHKGAIELRRRIAARYDQTSTAYEAIRRDIGRKNALGLFELFKKFEGFSEHPLRLLVLTELNQTFTRAKRLTDEASAASESGNFNEALNLYRLAYKVDPNPVVQCSIDLCKQLIESNSRIQVLRDSLDPDPR
ncbi:MAG: hypothetical protein HUU46_07405 [Candidatus Hydrogenedentes bacterium]|nr:hypothetical protein [Candidatus Hydrogenedentota bacterium]